jgi:uncharacterized protein YkwD
MSRKIVHFSAILSAILLAALAGVSVGLAQAGDPYSLIEAVNGLRAANGLPAYQENAILMSIAQDQTDYQAAIGECTHTGAGGTTPKQRAVAAGYGGGATFFLSENFVCGKNLSVDGAVSSWLQDAPHTQTMLGASYVEVGAGVSVAGDFVYYTLDVAYIAGGGNYIPPNTITPGGPTPLPYDAVQTVTPMPDGSLVHTVLAGQNLSLIAKAYGVLVPEIKDLNNLTSDNIYVGDKLLIRKASTPGPTSTATATSTATKAATPTLRPTRTSTPSMTPQRTTTETSLAPLIAGKSIGSRADPLGYVLMIAIVGLGAGGIILMVVGSLLKRRSKVED